MSHRFQTWPFPAVAALCVLGILLLGSLGGFVTAGQIGSWYSTLAQPPLTPPSWVFGPVWSLLYVMIGLALAFILHGDFPQRRRALWLFVTQLVLNVLWSPVFFGLHQMGIALGIIVLLVACLGWLIVLLWSPLRTASMLLFPYLLWVTFATYLNGGFLVLNR